MPGPHALKAALARLLPIVVVALAVALACLPLNLLDRAQDQLLQLLPRFSGGGWQPITRAMACSPVGWRLPPKAPVKVGQ